MNALFIRKPGKLDLRSCFLRMSWVRSWTGLALSNIAAVRASKPPTARTRVRKFRFGQDDDEEDIDYNLRLLDVPGFICSSRMFKIFQKMF